MQPEAKRRSADTPQVPEPGIVVPASVLSCCGADVLLTFAMASKQCLYSVRHLFSAGNALSLPLKCGCVRRREHINKMTAEIIRLFTKGQLFSIIIEDNFIPPGRNFPEELLFANQSSLQELKISFGLLGESPSRLLRSLVSLRKLTLYEGRAPSPTSGDVVLWDALQTLPSLTTLVSDVPVFDYLIHGSLETDFFCTSKPLRLRNISTYHVIKSDDMISAAIRSRLVMSLGLPLFQELRFLELRIETQIGEQFIEEVRRRQHRSLQSITKRLMPTSIFSRSPECDYTIITSSVIQHDELQVLQLTSVGRPTFSPAINCPRLKQLIGRFRTRVVQTQALPIGGSDCDTSLLYTQSADDATAALSLSSVTVNHQIYSGGSRNGERSTLIPQKSLRSFDSEDYSNVVAEELVLFRRDTLMKTLRSIAATIEEVDIFYCDYLSAEDFESLPLFPRLTKFCLRFYNLQNPEKYLHIVDQQRRLSFYKEKQEAPNNTYDDDTPCAACPNNSVRFVSLEFDRKGCSPRILNTIGHIMPHLQKLTVWGFDEPVCDSHLVCVLNRLKDLQFLSLSGRTNQLTIQQQPPLTCTCAQSIVSSNPNPVDECTHSETAEALHSLYIPSKLVSLKLSGLSITDLTFLTLYLISASESVQFLWLEGLPYVSSIGLGLLISQTWLVDDFLPPTTGRRCPSARLKTSIRVPSPKQKHIIYSDIGPIYKNFIEEQEILNESASLSLAPHGSNSTALKIGNMNFPLASDDYCNVFYDHFGPLLPATGAGFLQDYAPLPGLSIPDDEGAEATFPVECAAPPTRTRSSEPLPEERVAGVQTAGSMREHSSCNSSKSSAKSCLTASKIPLDKNGRFMYILEKGLKAQSEAPLRSEKLVSMEIVTAHDRYRIIQDKNSCQNEPYWLTNTGMKSVRTSNRATTIENPHADGRVFSYGDTKSFQCLEDVLAKYSAKRIVHIHKYEQLQDPPIVGTSLLQDVSIVNCRSLDAGIISALAICPSATLRLIQLKGLILTEYEVMSLLAERRNMQTQNRHVQWDHLRVLDVTPVNLAQDASVDQTLFEKELSILFPETDIIFSWKVNRHASFMQHR